MRAMWSAATGMKSLQMAIDTVANNLSNVNTSGFKRQRIEFKDLLYEKLDFKNGDDGLGAPVNLEVGHGVTPVATVRQFKQGSILPTENQLDVAIEGEGFFEVVDQDGQVYYTRDGSFKFGLTEDGNRLVTADGYLVQGVDGEINLDGEYSEISIDQKGVVSVKYNDSEDATLTEIGRIKLVKVPNPAGMISKGLNFYKTTAASGEAVVPEDESAGTLLQGFIETSNVQVVEEMINLITMQRAYEINSKTIQTSDQMLELANNLKR